MILDKEHTTSMTSQIHVENSNDSVAGCHPLVHRPQQHRARLAALARSLRVVAPAQCHARSGLRRQREQLLPHWEGAELTCAEPTVHNAIAIVCGVLQGKGTARCDSPNLVGLVGGAHC